ncbi:uncharacterized protein LOC144213582 [Stigmatopora nigra]
MRCHMFLSRRAASGLQLDHFNCGGTGRLQLWKNYIAIQTIVTKEFTRRCRRQLGRGQGRSPNWRLHWTESANKKVVQSRFKKNICFSHLELQRPPVDTGKLASKREWKCALTYWTTSWMKSDCKNQRQKSKLDMGRTSWK